MQRSKLAKREWLLVAAAAAVAYFYGLGRAPFVGPDEPRYAQVAREMFERGDLVTPTLAGHTWFEKPALVYWAVAAGFKLFGVSEWSARLGAALAGWLTVLTVGWTAGRVESHDGARSRGLQLACGGVAASSAGLIVFARGVNFDIFITATIALALGCYLAAELEGDGRKRRWLLAGFYAGVGASLLAKGLVGIVLPFGVVALYALLSRRRPAAWKSALWGLPLAALVAGVWYAPVLARHGWSFVEEFFVQHHFARYVSNRYRHPQPFYFYLLIIPLLALPWTAFLADAIARARRWRWRATDDGAGRSRDGSLRGDEDAAREKVRDTREEAGDASREGVEGLSRERVEAVSREGVEAVDRLRLFALAWVVVPIAFFSLSGSKLPGYILPALPGAALLAGQRLAAYARGEGGEWPMRTTGALVLAFAAGCVGYAARTGEASVACALLVAAPPAVAAACSLLSLGTRASRAAQVVGAALLAAMLAAGCALEGVARRETVGELLRLAAARGYADAPVWNLHTVERTAEFYAAGRLQYDARGEPALLEGSGEVREALGGRGGPALVFVPSELEYQVSEFPPVRAERIGDNGRVALYAVRLR